MSWNDSVVNNNNNNNLSRTNSNVPGGTNNNRRATSPSMGRQTSLHHSHAVDWMRRTLMQAEPPSRIPGVFVDAERRTSPSATSRNRSRSPVFNSGRRDNHKIVTPSLVQDAINQHNHHPPHLGGASSPSSSTNGKWRTTKYENEFTTTGISPHRLAHHLHTNTVPLRATGLTKTVQLGGMSSLSMNATFNNKPLVMRTGGSGAAAAAVSMSTLSASRSNTPRWADPSQLAAARAHSATRTLSISAADAGVDLIARDSVHAVRNLQRSANSTLPVCNTVGVDNSGCTCAGRSSTSGELMVHAIDTLLRANRNDGAVSPQRQQLLIRANSSPVANRVENIVKKEVEKRVQKEREKFEEEERVREEFRQLKEAEAEMRHQVAVSRAQKEAAVAKQMLTNEQSARARAEAEEMAAKERLARTTAEDEARKLREELSKIDSKIISPGRVRVGEAVQPHGNAEMIADVIKMNGMSNKSGNPALNNNINNNKRAVSEAKSDDSTDEYATWNSVRKVSDTKLKVGTGHYDPVSSSALQRQDILQKNFAANNDDALKATRNNNSNNNQSQSSPKLLSAHATNLNNCNNNNNDGVESVVSQLASAGSSPFSGTGRNPRGGQQQQQTMANNDEDFYEDEDGNVISLRAPQVGMSVIRTGRGNANNNNNNNNNDDAAKNNATILSNSGVPTAIVRAPQLVNGEIIFGEGYKKKTDVSGPPIVGMKERDSHLMDLMRKTQERHGNVVASQKARLDARMNNFNNNRNNQNNEATTATYNYNLNNAPSSSSTPNRSLITENNNNNNNFVAGSPYSGFGHSGQRPTAELDNSYTAISPIPAAASQHYYYQPQNVNLTYDQKSSSPVRHEINNNNHNHNVLPTTTFQDGSRVSFNNTLNSVYGGGDDLSTTTNGGVAAANSTSAHSSPGYSPFRPSTSAQQRNQRPELNLFSAAAASGGPHYSPETLVEPPMQAAPSGLWVARTAAVRQQQILQQQQQQQQQTNRYY